MDITPLVPEDRQYIQSYGGGGFRISNQRHDGAVLVLPTRTLAWPVSDVASVTLESLSEIVTAAAEIEILLVGFGRSMRPIPRDVRDALRGHGIVADPMDTGAACRTYNVLLTEDRRVAAALFPVD